MPVTETRVARSLRRGEIDVDTVLELFYHGDVLVYAALNIDPMTASWNAVQDSGQNTSGLMHELAQAGATQADIIEVGIQIQRARDEGRTIQAHYGWEEPTETVPPP